MSFLKKQSVREYSPGDIIFKEGETGHSMFILQKGTVEVYKLINGQNTSIATIKEGAIFGEMALVGDSRRSATIQAKTKAKCMEMSRMLFSKKMEEIPTWMKTFYEVLVNRLRDTNERVDLLPPVDRAKQVVLLLQIIARSTDADRLGRKRLVWKQVSEEISFLLNRPIEEIDKTMLKIALTDLASSETDYQLGRIFKVLDVELYDDFAEYCKAKYAERTMHRDVEKFKKLSKKEKQLLSFVGKLMKEQAYAPDIHINFFQRRMEKDLKQSPSDFEYEIKDLIRTGLFAPKTDESGSKYYDVDRHILESRLGVSNQMTLFEKIEGRLF